MSRKAAILPTQAIIIFYKKNIWNARKRHEYVGTKILK